MAVIHLPGNNADKCRSRQVTPPSNDDIKLKDTDGERDEEDKKDIMNSYISSVNETIFKSWVAEELAAPKTTDEQKNHEEQKTEDVCNRDAMRYRQWIKIRDCVFLKLQWMFSMPVKNNGKIQIMIMFLLILGANGKDYDVRNMKNSLVSPKEVLQISDNVVPPDFSYTYVYFNMGNTAFVCSKEFAERNASCRIRPYTSTSCQGWQGVSNGSTWYLAFNESKMPDFSKLLYCIYQAVPEELTLYQGSISRTPVDGGWGNWSSLGICSATCGGGRQYWHRKCNSPIPKYGGLDCSGESLKEQSCNNNSKCPIDGGWGEWTNWSNYSAISGGESRFRNRSCSDPTPKYGGSNCSGKSSEEQIRMIQDSPNPWKIWFIIVLVLLLVLSALIVIGIKYYLWQKEKGNEKESAKESVKYRRSRADDDDSAVEV